MGSLTVCPCELCVFQVDAGGKETFACGGCARRTVRCETCTSDVGNNTPGAKENYGLAKGGDRRCARCLGIVYDWRAPPAVNASLHRWVYFYFRMGNSILTSCFVYTEPRGGVHGAANDARTWSVIRHGRGASVWCAGAVPRRAICARGSCARANVHGCQPRVPVGEIDWDGQTLESPRARACAARLSARARVPMRLRRCGRWYRRVAPRLMPPPRTSATSSSGAAGGPNARRRGERGGPSRC